MSYDKDYFQGVTMNDEETLPPRQPNTPRVLLKRFWAWAVRKVSAYPDRALILFLVLLGAAVIA